jgi:hypothetical protein
LREEKGPRRSATGHDTSIHNEGTNRFNIKVVTVLQINKGKDRIKFSCFCTWRASNAVAILQQTMLIERLLCVTASAGKKDYKSQTVRIIRWLSRWRRRRLVVGLESFDSNLSSGRFWIQKGNG